MGSSHGNFVKYPRTPHLFGSTGTDDDKRLSEVESLDIISDPSLIVEEKLDGTNVGIHFTTDSQMMLQCRGHLITEGMHPQYDLFKQWSMVKRAVLEQMLGCGFILFGEWLYARHSVHYQKLPHYFFEFDIYDKQNQVFLSFDRRMAMLAGTGIRTVPILHTGPVKKEQLGSLIGPSRFASRFENPGNGRIDRLMEGLYVRTEAGGTVTARAKYVRAEFVEKIKESTHWQHQAMIPNLLSDDADIWS